MVQQQRLPGTFRKRVRKGKTTYQARLQLRGQPEQCVSLGTDLQAALRRFADIQRQCLDLNPAMGEPASVAAVAHLWLERSQTPGVRTTRFRSAAQRRIGLVFRHAAMRAFLFL